jgi:hypothetical protein
MAANSNGYDVDKERIRIEPDQLTPRRNFITHVKGDVDPEQATGPLIGYCFMTGLIDSVSFSAIFVWCGFQTGNGTQLALALARLFSGPPGHRDTSFHNADKLALTSLISFALGATIGRIGDKMGPKSRAWLMLGTFIQALFTMSAALTIWKSGEGSVADNRGDALWTNVLSFTCVVFLSMSLGLQGIMGKRINTQFTTTIVLTTTWCELMADPNLFRRHYTRSRDHKIIAIAILFFGGFVGRCMIDKIGSAGTLGVGTGIRFLIALSWYLVPSKKSKS